MVVMASAGNSHSAAVDDKGLLYVWGEGSNSKLSFSDSYDRYEPPFLSPTPVHTPHVVVPTDAGRRLQSPSSPVTCVLTRRVSCAAADCGAVQA